MNTLAMSAKTVAGLLKQAGYTVTAVSEPDDLVDGEVQLACGKHVQVCEDGFLIVVEELDEETYRFGDCRNDFNDILEDLRG